MVELRRGGVFRRGLGHQDERPEFKPDPFWQREIGWGSSVDHRAGD